MLLRYTLILVAIQQVWGQTLIDLKTQSRNTELAASRTTPTALTIGGNCSVYNPCNVRFGNLAYSFVASPRATISAGSGTAFIYLTPNGNLTVGHTMSVTCGSGCTATPGVTGFPAGTIPLFTWTATNGTWDATGGVDWRAFQSTANVNTGGGLLGTAANGVTTISIDPTMVGVRMPVPPSSASSCAQGSWASDTSFFYVCVASNTWRRGALTTW